MDFIYSDESFFCLKFQEALILGEFPIKIESQISMLGHIHTIEIAKLHVISRLIWVSILIGNPQFD